jgi:hypothetical protein
LQIFGIGKDVKARDGGLIASAIPPLPEETDTNEEGFRQSF